MSRRITAPGDQADTVAVPLDADAEAVLLDFVKLPWPGRNLGCTGGQAELKRLKHALKIGVWPANCQSVGVVVDEARDRHRRLAAIELGRDVFGHVARPALGGVESDDADW